MIMKKQYINPEMEIIEVEMQQMIATSLGVSSDPTDTVDSRDDLDLLIDAIGL